MIHGVHKNYDGVTVFYSVLCEGCAIYDSFNISYQEYYQHTDEELLEKYGLY